MSKPESSAGAPTPSCPMWSERPATGRVPVRVSRRSAGRALRAGRGPDQGACRWPPPPPSAVFLLLQAAFGSWRLGILAFLTLPVALAGGVLAELIGGRTFTLVPSQAWWR